MKRILTTAAGVLLAATFFAGAASAQELRGRLAVTAKVGVVNPADNERNPTAGETIVGSNRIVVPTDAGLLFGGGLLYGLDDSLAFELEISRSEVDSSGYPAGFGDVEVKDLSFGVQYRFPERSRVVPYGSAGLDVLINDASARQVSAIDTVFGAHVAAGVDYFLTRQMVINAELKGIEAFDADVKDLTGNKIGTFDPTNLTFTVGVRFFLN